MYYVYIILKTSQFQAEIGAKGLETGVKQRQMRVRGDRLELNPFTSFVTAAWV